MSPCACPTPWRRYSSNGWISISRREKRKFCSASAPCATASSTIRNLARGCAARASSLSRSSSCSRSPAARPASKATPRASPPPRSAAFQGGSSPFFERRTNEVKMSLAKPLPAAATPRGLPMIRTVEQHILEQQRNFPHATGEFSWLLSGITLATKIIQAQIQRAGLLEVIGQTGQVNVQAARVEKLDEIANKTLRHCLPYRGTVRILVSEEDQEPHVIQEAEAGKYIVLFDPLDGSSNINANVSIGTIFSILQRDAGHDGKDVMAHILQPGCKQVAAGYVVSGSSTVLAYTAGDGVHMFTRDRWIGHY